MEIEGVKSPYLKSSSLIEFAFPILLVPSKDILINDVVKGVVDVSESNSCFSKSNFVTTFSLTFNVNVSFK